MERISAWVMAATLVCGSSLFTACVTDYGDNPVTPKVRIAQSAYSHRQGELPR